MALKGVVRLQAVVRGQNTRRLILTRLKSLQSIAKPQVHQIIIPQKVLVNKDNKVPVLACYGLDGILCVPYLYQFWELNLVYIYVITISWFLSIHLLQTGCSISKNWEDSMMSKEDREVSWLQRQDAIARRDRMKKYSFSHRVTSHF